MASDYRDGYLEILEGKDNLYERDILRIIYGNAYGGKENPQLISRLLERFPSVKSIIAADRSEIMAVEGMPENFALYLKTLDRIVKLLNKSDLFINSTEDCFKVIDERLRIKDNEHVEIYLVNRSGKVVDIKSYTSQKIDRVDISASSIFSIISSCKAYGLYFAHNHVNAAVTPSADDDAVTAKIYRACEICGIKFFDHCIINSRGETFSYVLSGKLSKILQKHT